MSGDLVVLRRRAELRHEACAALLVRGLRATSVCALPAVISVAMLTAVTGWLYRLRPEVASWPGPSIPALPLDELAHHDRVPLVVVLVLLGISSATAGLAARAANLDRLSAATVLGVSSGAWCYLAVAASYYVARQVALVHALDEAAAAPVVYLATALPAFAGAVLGRSRRAGSVATTLAAAGVALAGAFDVLAAFLRARPNALAAVSPSVLLHLARAVDLPVGVLLLVSSRGLTRRSLAAWRIAVLALGVSSLVRFVSFPDRYPAALLMAALAAVLVAQRAQHEARADPAVLCNAPGRVCAVFFVTASVIALGVLVHQAHAEPHLGYGKALLQTLQVLNGHLSPGPGGERHFFVWFPWTVSATLALGVLWAVAPWVAPWRPRFQRGASEAEDARRIVRRHGRDSLAPFVLRADKSLFFAPGGAAAEEQAVVAYRVVRGIALASGAPIGPASARLEAMAAFRSFAHQRGWTVGVLGVSAEDLALYESIGFMGIYHGDEAFIDVGRFTLHGGRMKAVRQAVNRIERCGYQSSVVDAGDVPPLLRRRMNEVESAWMGGARRTGFSMELDELFRLGGDDALFVLGMDGAGDLAGFVHLVACRASRTMSLSSMPLLDEVPNGFSSWLIVRCVEWCALNGVDALSLNFAPLAGVFDAEVPSSAWRRTQRRAAMRVKAALSLQLDNLQLFNRQFCPEFRPRYVVLERWTDLPRVVVAALAAEGYLPFAERVRGWPAPRGLVPDPAPCAGSERRRPASGVRAGAASGDESGAAPGDESGAAPGDESGAAPRGAAHTVGAWGARVP